MSDHDGNRTEGDNSKNTRAASKRQRVRAALLLVVAGFVLVAVGTALAGWVTTGGGETTVEEATIQTASGQDLTATVYKPAGVTPDNPAPAVTLIHGRSAERDSMSSFAREFTKRGYVVVAVDQPGHRDSEPPVGADGWGGPPALSFTNSRPVVETGNVSLVGHSMGGFASLAAAATYPDSYQSVVLVGSAWGPVEMVEDVPRANGSFPRNLAVVYGTFDEFTGQMWNGTAPGTVHETTKLATVFGVKSPVEDGRTYGEVTDGTARTFVSAPTVHNGMHRSSTAVEAAVSWVDRSADEPDSQDWHWATLGHVLSLVGGLGLGVGTTALVWHRIGPQQHSREHGEGTSLRTRLTATVVPALTVMPLYGIGTLSVPVTWLTHQELTHGYIVWGVGVLAVGFGLVRWRNGMTRETIRQRTPSRDTTLRAVGAALVGAGTLYVVVTAVSAVPGGGLRGWLVWLVPLTPTRWLSVGVYVLPFTAVTVGLAFALDYIVPSRGLLWDTVSATAVSCGGLLVVLAVQYLPLFLGVGMPIPALAPLALTALWVLWYLTIATVCATVGTRLTGEPLAGGVFAGFVVTWLIAGTGAIFVSLL